MSAGPIDEKTLTTDWGWPDYGSAADRDRERTLGMTDEWTDDEPDEPSEAWKIMREASRLQSLAMRAADGEDIDWEPED